MLYQLSYRPINYLQESPNLELRLESGMGYLDYFQPLHDQSTCEGMKKAMPSEIFYADRVRGEVAVVRSLP